MPSSTPRFTYPYPIGTDRVSDGDNAIQALAERVEAVEGPVSALVLLSAGVANVNEGSHVYKSGGLVVLHLSVTIAGGASAASVIFAAPAGFLPRDIGRGVMWGQLAANPPGYYPITMGLDGNAYSEVGVSGGTALRGTLVYPLA